jgi:hypothetical protein
VDLTKSRNITVTGKLQKQLWEKFHGTEVGSEKADSVLESILRNSKNQNEVFLVFCNARSNHWVRKAALDRLLYRRVTPKEEFYALAA